ncbi:unnamed protein product [Somion occarium]|uniref:HNH nuclease domain-containing protein n=1 Tax=Somion occarium TaxID=3059160 RepID=A0ABP1DX14_9APHY
MSLDVATDVFIWWPYRRASIAMGFNSHRTGPITPSRVCRWMHILDPLYHDGRAVLRPVQIQKCGVLLYDAQVSGPVLNEDAYLMPGDYGYFPAESKEGLNWRVQPFRSLPSVTTIERERELAIRLPKLFARQPHILEVPAEFQEVVQRRDSGRCFVSGTSPEEGAELEVTWIFPPASVSKFDWPRPGHPNAVVADNTAAMRKDILPSFRRNVFGVDVDDNRRIVTFYDTGSTQLPTHLPTSIPGPSDQYLRMHLRWCLVAFTTDLDIMEEIDWRDIVRLEEELGLTGEDADCGVVPADDERWQTPLGREIWEDVIRRGLWDTMQKQKTEEEEDEEPVSVIDVSADGWPADPYRLTR